MSKTKKVLLTGASGFTGTYLQEALTNNGHQVFGTTLNAKVGFTQVDLTNSDYVEHLVKEINPTSIVHLAGVSFAGDTDIPGIYNSNVLATRNLLAAVEHFAPNIESVIVASSASVYGSNKTPLLSEDSTLLPKSDYAISKACVEVVAKSWMERIPVIITRPFNYTGVGQNTSFVIPKIVSAFKKRSLSLNLGNTSVFRDFSDVRDVAKVYTGLVEKPSAGTTFNISSGRAISLNEVIKVAERLSGNAINIEIDPQLIRPNEVERQTGSSEKLRNWLDIQSWREIEETIEWMLSGSNIIE